MQDYFESFISIFIIFLASWDAIEPGLVSDSKNRVDWCDPGEWRYLLNTLLRDSVVLIMEVDKVVDEVTDMKIDK